MTGGERGAIAMIEKCERAEYKKRERGKDFQGRGGKKKFLVAKRKLKTGKRW